MRIHGMIGSASIMTLVALTWLVNRSPAQTIDARSNSDERTKVNVFFGASKAMSVEEIRTNALIVLRARGHHVPETSRCVINVKVQGSDPGSAVLFWDLEAKMTWQVLFNSRGEVSHVSGGVMGHGTPAPGELRPKMPKEGVRQKL